MSEFDWIARYFAPLARGAGAAGLGDDVAALSGHAGFVTVDALVEGVHFLPTDPIDTIARKLVRVNVSDIIAKGGVPDEALLTLGWPKTRGEDELAIFADALGKSLDHWGAKLIGGDTVASPGGLFLSLTLTGRLPEGGHIVRRSGAQIGDTIWLSGEIGWGGRGLEDALAGRASAAREAYRVPDIPPLEMAGLISAYANASMDVSDGLLGDLVKLCEASGLGGVLDLEAVPLCLAAAEKVTLEAVFALCTAGDDYQCLFTAPQSATAPLSAANVKLTPIGCIIAGNGLQARWHGKAVKMPEHTGFMH